MPALGHTIGEDIVKAEQAKMSRGGFARAYGNLWVPSSYGDQVIPAADWTGCEDNESVIDGDGVVFTVDVAPNSSWASIVVTGYRSDGIPHGEVIDHQAGDGWVVARLVELRERWGKRPVALDPTGPAGALLPQLAAAGIAVTASTAREMVQACGALKSGAKERAFRHTGQPILTDALAGADTRQLLDAWAFRRRSSSCDISPLVAFTIGLWALSTIPQPKNYSAEELLRSVG